MSVQEYLLTRQVFELVDFDEFLVKNRSKRTIEDIFGNEPKAWSNQDFALVYYFLFHTWKPKKTSEWFRGIWPIRDVKQEADFRKVIFEVLKKANEDGEIDLGTVTMIHFQRRSGAGFHTITAKLTLHILSIGVEDPYPGKSHEELDLIYEERQAKLEAYETQVSQYLVAVEKKIEERKEELSKLKKDQVQSHITVDDVNRVTKEIEAINTIMIKATELMKNEKLNEMRKGQGDHVVKFVESLPKSLRMLDELASLYKANKRSNLVDSIRNAKDLGKSFEEAKQLLQRGLARKKALEDEIEELKKQILETPRAREVHAAIRAKFAPILDLKFELPNLDNLNLVQE